MDKPNVLDYKYNGLKVDFVHNVADEHCYQAAAIWMPLGLNDKKRG